MIPTGVFLFAFEATLFSGFAFEDIDAHVSEDGWVFRSVSAADAALVFGKADIQ